MSAEAGERLGREELRSLFAKPTDAREQIGLEIESGVVNPATGLAAPYAGKNGVAALMRMLATEFGGEPQFDGEHLMGIQTESGMHLTLEHGGAIEYVSVPVDRLTTAVDQMRDALTRLGEVARRLGLAILPGANLPFNRIEDVPWVPKRRGAVMREFFARLGDPGRYGPTVMGLTLSTQATFDYRSEDDLAEKVRMQVAASPVIAAMFVNSPLEGGRLTGLQSRRSQYWLKCDPCRCGLLPPALQERMTFDDFINWAVNVPMIYYSTSGGGYRLANRTFADILTKGFDDGRMPILEDWLSHLSQVWTDVRVRRTLELRAADGPPYPHIPAVPMLWAGLTYHPDSRSAAWDLLRHYRPSDIRRTINDVPGAGLRASLGKVPVRELGRELVRLARAGLAARVDAGVEEPRLLAYLDPIEEVVESGSTFADQVIRRWDGEFRCDPARYVAAFRV
jgi:glutamate--cysteine ligase